MGLSHDAAYRSVKAISASSLKIFHSASPRAFHMYMEGQSFFKDSAAKKFGTLVHCAILEPHELELRYVALPSDTDLRTKAGKEAMENLRLSFPEAEVVKPDELEQAKNIRDAVLSDAFIRDIILSDSSKFESPIYWKDKETGLECKALFDCYNSSMSLILDVKTTRKATARAFNSDVLSYGYHIQAAHYLDGGGLDEFLFLAVEKEPPYDFCVYRLSADYMEYAQSLRRDLLHRIHDHYKSNYWPTLNEAFGPFVTLNPPAWITNGKATESYQEAEDNKDDFDIASL